MKMIDPAERYLADLLAFREEHPDCDEVIDQEIPLHAAVQHAVMELPNGVEVAYYLGKNPEFARRLADLTPLGAVMELGFLSAMLAAQAPHRRGTHFLIH